MRYDTPQFRAPRPFLTIARQADLGRIQELEKTEQTCHPSIEGWGVGVSTELGIVTFVLQYRPIHYVRPDPKQGAHMTFCMEGRVSKVVLYIRGGSPGPY